MEVAWSFEFILSNRYPILDVAIGQIAYTMDTCEVNRKAQHLKDILATFFVILNCKSNLSHYFDYIIITILDFLSKSMARYFGLEVRRSFLPLRFTPFTVQDLPAQFYECLVCHRQLQSKLRYIQYTSIIYFKKYYKMCRIMMKSIRYLTF